MDFIKDNIGDMKFVGSIKFNDAIMAADIKGASPYNCSPESVNEAREIKEGIEKSLGQ
jgi:CO dehydrogenase nickel-insertion accessory protein CooC1